MALIVLAYTVSTVAAPPLPAAPTPAPSGSASPATDYNVKMTADVLTYDEKSKLLKLDGNVTFTHIDTVITSPHAEFETEKQIGHFTGGVRITQPGTTLTGDLLDAYYTESRAVMVGHVQMVTERAPNMDGGGGGKKSGEALPPPPSPQKVSAAPQGLPPVPVPATVPTSLPSVTVPLPQDSMEVPIGTATPIVRKTPPTELPSPVSVTTPAVEETPAAVPTAAAPVASPAVKPSPKPKPRKAEAAEKKPPAERLPTIMLADQIVYFWDKDEGDAIGNVKIRQGEKRAYSDRAHYNGAAAQIRLFSNVRMERGPNDTMISEEAIVYLDQQQFEARGGVEATVLVQQTPQPATPLLTPQGDRVLKPTPPTIQEHPAPDGLPRGVLKSGARGGAPVSRRDSQPAR